MAAYLNNKKRDQIKKLEEEGGMVVKVLSNEGLYPEHLEMDYRNSDGKTVRV